MAFAYYFLPPSDPNQKESVTFKKRLRLCTNQYTVATSARDLFESSEPSQILILLTQKVSFSSFFFSVT